MAANRYSVLSEESSVPTSKGKGKNKKNKGNKINSNKITSASINRNAVTSSAQPSSSTEDDEPLESLPALKESLPAAPPPVALTGQDEVEEEVDSNGVERPADAKPAEVAAEALEETASTVSRSKPKEPPVYLERPFVWIDLEMTGLDLDQHTIIEIACVITDCNLLRIIKGPEIVIHASEEEIGRMNEWCVENHGKSGLTARVRASTIGMKEAEDQVLEFVEKYTNYKQAIIAGNTVHTDKIFIERYMPRLADHLHYRILDVSSVKELSARWFPKEHRKAPRKTLKHRAMDDILESIEELKYYKRAIFRPH